jgi:hypothetical protein
VPEECIFSNGEVDMFSFIDPCRPYILVIHTMIATTEDISDIIDLFIDICLSDGHLHITEMAIIV